jgi:hypothetical protein
VSEALHCGHCGDVIGVYEPLIRLLHGRPHETSRALEPDTSSDEDCYHRACYLRLNGKAGRVD